MVAEGDVRAARHDLTIGGDHDLAAGERLTDRAELEAIGRLTVRAGVVSVRP